MFCFFSITHSLIIITIMSLVTIDFTCLCFLPQSCRHHWSANEHLYNLLYIQVETFDFLQVLYSRKLIAFLVKMSCMLTGVEMLVLYHLCKIMDCDSSLKLLSLKFWTIIVIIINYLSSLILLLLSSLKLLLLLLWSLMLQRSFRCSK